MFKFMYEKWISTLVWYRNIIKKKEYHHTYSTSSYLIKKYHIDKSKKIKKKLKNFQVLLTYIYSKKKEKMFASVIKL